MDMPLFVEEEKLFETSQEEIEEGVAVSLKLNSKAIEGLIENYGMDFARMELERCFDRAKFDLLITLDLLG